MNTKLDFPKHLSGDRYRVDWLANFPEPSMQRLRAIGIKRTFHDGQLVQKRGDSAHHVLVVLSGRLRSVGYTAGGAEQFTRWMEPGEISGFSSVLGNAPVPVDLVAAGDVELLILPSQPLLEVLASDALASLAVARALSLRVNELFDMIFIRAEETLNARVWATLQRIAAENGKPAHGNVVLLISQGDLAHAVGASRQKVNVELRKLQAQQKIRLGYRWIEIFCGTQP